MIQPFCHFLTLLCEDAEYAEIISWDERMTYKFTIRNRVALARLWAKFHGSTANSKEIKKMLRDHVTRHNLICVYSEPAKRCYGYQAISLKWKQVMADQIKNEHTKLTFNDDMYSPPVKRKTAKGPSKKAKSKQSVNLSMVKVEPLAFASIPTPPDVFSMYANPQTLYNPPTASMLWR